MNENSELTGSEKHLLYLFRWLKTLVSTLRKLFLNAANSKKARITFVVIVFLPFLLLAFIVTQSVGIKKRAYALYRQGEYKQALEEFQIARRWWVFERVSLKLRDRDLYAKINDAEIMTRSTEFFENGIVAFNENDFSEAKYNLSNVLPTDIRYSQAQDKILEIEATEKQQADKVKEDDAQNIASLNSNPQPNDTNVSTENNIETTPQSVFQTNPTVDKKHPIIVKVSDSKGNYTTGSTGNDIPFFVTWPDPKPKVEEGETIVIKVEATDPKGKELRYKFMNNMNKTLKDWSTSNTLNWKVSNDGGGNPFIVPMIKNDDDVLRYGDVDDSAVLYYELR